VAGDDSGSVGVAHLERTPLELHHRSPPFSRVRNDLSQTLAGRGADTRSRSGRTPRDDRLNESHSTWWRWAACEASGRVTSSALRPPFRVEVGVWGPWRTETTRVLAAHALPA
jgi:hypothetical protein